MSRKSLSRRAVLGATAALIPFPVWFAEYGAKANPPLVRYSAQSTQGAAMLAKYSTGVAQMMAKTAGDPVSWTFQWFTHAVRGDSTKMYQLSLLPSSQQPLASAMWNTCQAHTNWMMEDFFLPWHRMFVYFFERIVRKACGDQTFTLPYWDYTDAAQRAIPSPFYTPPNSGNPLYSANRNPGINTGTPIDQGIFPSPINTNLGVMVEGSYSPVSNHGGFNMDLDQGLHGQVHVLVGNGNGMGQIPWAANDPIFWLHHCNIDRLWASWDRCAGANPTSSSWLNQMFTFADENGTRVSATVQDFNAITQLNYTYDRFYPYNFRQCFAHVIQRSNQVIMARGASIGPFTLSGSNTFQTQLTTQGQIFFKKDLRGLPARDAAQLVIRGLYAPVTPGVLYAVYIGPSAEQFVGYLNFFNATPMPGMTMKGRSDGRFFSFDVTSALRALGHVADDQPFPVTISPVGTPDADATYGSIHSIELVVAEK